MIFACKYQLVLDNEKVCVCVCVYIPAKIYVWKIAPDMRVMTASSQINLAQDTTRSFATGSRRFSLLGLVPTERLKASCAWENTYAAARALSIWCTSPCSLAEWKQNPEFSQDYFPIGKLSPAEHSSKEKEKEKGEGRSVPGQDCAAGAACLRLFIVGAVLGGGSSSHPTITMRCASSAPGS